MLIRGELYIILANLIFATMGIFTRELSNELLPITQVSYRLILAATIYFAVFSLKDHSFFKTSRKNLFFLFLAGFFGYGLMVVFIALSFLNTQYGNATTFLQFTSVFTLLMGWLFLHEKIKLNALIAVVLSFIAVVVVFRPDFSNLDIGIALALVSSLFNATYYTIVRRLKDVDIRQRQFYTTFFGGFFLVPLILFLEQPLKISFSSITGFYLILMAILNIIGIYLINLGIKTVNASVAGILTVSQALFGIVISYILYGEALNYFEIIGAALIVSSIIILNLDLKGYKKESGG